MGKIEINKSIVFKRADSLFAMYFEGH